MVEGNTVRHWWGSRRGGMPDMLEGRLVLEMMRHHGMFRRSVGVPRRGSHVLIFLIVVVHILLTHEVFGAFVFVSSAILYSLSV